MPRTIGASATMNVTVISNRCTYRTAAGRQCRLLAADTQSTLCTHHRSLQKQKESADFSRQLLSNAENFQTAQGVNLALSELYELLAANRISARRAAVLAYINSLLLRTLPAIDAESQSDTTQPIDPGWYANRHNATPPPVPASADPDPAKKPS